MSAETNNAALTTFALRAIREGELDHGLLLLEQSVDGATLAYWGYLDTGDSDFDQLLVVAKSHEVMRPVAEYRESYPPVSSDKGVLESIHEALASIPDHP